MLWITLSYLHLSVLKTETNLSVVWEKLGFSGDSSEEKDHEFMKNGVMEEVKRLFKPEFLNRIDDMIVFHVAAPALLVMIIIVFLKSTFLPCASVT